MLKFLFGGAGDMYLCHIIMPCAFVLVLGYCTTSVAPHVRMPPSSFIIVEILEANQSMNIYSRAVTGYNYQGWAS